MIDATSGGAHSNVCRIERVSDEDSPIRDDFSDDHLYILYSISDSFSTP